MIEWQKEIKPIETWKVRSKDGIWQLEFDGNKEKDSLYWLYNFSVMFGAFAPSEEETLPCFIKALKEHIKAEQELIAEIESGEAK